MITGHDRIHIQIPPTDYRSLLLYRITMVTSSWCTFEGTMREQEATVNPVASEYPHSTLNSTPICFGLMDSLSYETYVAGWSEGIWMCSFTSRHVLYSLYDFKLTVMSRVILQMLYTDYP